MTSAHFKWFEAEFTGGRCGTPGCKYDIKRGDIIAYFKSEYGRILIRRECCGEQADLILVDVTAEPESESEDTFDSNPQMLLPPGRTKTDACSKCFIIHTTVQGDECW